MNPTDEEVMAALCSEWRTTEAVRRIVFGEVQSGPRRDRQIDILRDRLRKLAKWGFVERRTDSTDPRCGAEWRLKPREDDCDDA